MLFTELPVKVPKDITCGGINVTMRKMLELNGGSRKIRCFCKFFGFYLHGTSVRKEH